MHWLATGEQCSRLSLTGLSGPTDILTLQVRSEHYSGDWLTGFGWDQNVWSSKEFPSREILDQRFPTTPVAFTRVDGHALWVNTLALQRAGLIDSNGAVTPLGASNIEGGQVIRDSRGLPTGVLIDLALERIVRLIPGPTPETLRRNLLRGQSVFHRAGFTHIRDLSGSEIQWNEQVALEENDDLNLAVDQFFNANQPSDFHRALASALQARRSWTRLSRVKGMKIYFDGALGSEGALLSQCYCGRNHRGIQLISRPDFQSMMEETWSHDLELAVHAIGDQATREVITMARKVWNKNGRRGRLHVEHAQLMDRETIEMMKGSNVVCHFQPCHWLSDRHWMKEKIGDLNRYAFQWRELELAHIPFFFGSDSPIEPSHPFLSLLAVDEGSRAGIPRLLRDFHAYHSHPDGSLWTPLTETHFDGVHAKRVFFLGREIPTLE